MRLLALGHWRTGAVGVVAGAAGQWRTGMGVAGGGSGGDWRAGRLLVRFDGGLSSDGSHTVRGRGRGLRCNPQILRVLLHLVCVFT